MSLYKDKEIIGNVKKAIEYLKENDLESALDILTDTGCNLQFDIEDDPESTEDMQDTLDLLDETAGDLSALVEYEEKDDETVASVIESLSAFLED